MGLTKSLENSEETVDIEESKDVNQDALELQGIVHFVKERFERAKTARLQHERRWLKAYKNFRGLQGDMSSTYSAKEKSKVFPKITKTKVLAAIAQINDSLYPGQKFPIGVETTPIPDGIEESVHFDPKEPQSPGIPVSRQTIAKDLKLGAYKDKLEPIKDKIKPGPGLTSTALTWEPAKDAAKKTDKKFQDMLEEGGARQALDNTIFELVLLGSGVFKGPMAKKKEYPKWAKSTESDEVDYSPEFKIISDYSHVSVWNSYPDPEAKASNQLSYFVERHQMNRNMLRELKTRPSFRPESIEFAIKMGPNYIKEYWEDTLDDHGTQVTPETFEVLELWGTIDKEVAEANSIEIPEEYKHLAEVQVNIWTCNDYPLRIVFNPFKPARIPYYVAPYELNPYSIFGIGVAENMEDSQMLMNGAFRMAIDNAALSGNNIFEVNTTYLSPGQDMEMYPGKVIYTEGPLGQAIQAIQIPNTTNQNFMIFDKARQIADEATGIPSYSHGQSGIQSVGRTASGMSMLMGASAMNIKTVVRNIDEYILTPLGQNMYSYLMQFEYSEDYIGDFEIVALGSQSLMKNEIRSQKIQQALQITANPMDAPFIKREYLLRELMESMDIDADKSVNDLREAGIQAEVMKQMMLAQGIDPSTQQPQGTQSPGGSPGGSPDGAPGASPPPGDPGFSGTGGGANGGNTQNRPGEQGVNPVKPM